MPSQQAWFSNVPVDTVRSFWNTRPCNIRHSPKPVGTREYFDEVEARRYFVESHIPRFAQFENWRGKRVLEIGCGIGTDTISFARHGATVTAVELSDESLSLARQRAHVYGLEDRIRFYQGDAERLAASVPIEPYDLVYSFGVIHHTPQPGAVLDQIRRYVTPESTVKIMVYNRRSWKVLWIIMAHGKRRFWDHRTLVARYSEAQTGCPVTYTFTRAEACRWLREHGFEPQEVSVDHIFPYSIPEYREHRYRKVWYFRALPTPLFRALERRCGWHLCLTAKPAY